MSGAVEAREAGWRPDPSGRFEWRYWDGGWTNRVANSVPAAASAAVAQPQPQPQPQPIPAAAVPAAVAVPAVAALEPAARVEPFGVATTTAPAVEQKPARVRRRPREVILAFFRS